METLETLRIKAFRFFLKSYQEYCEQCLLLSSHHINIRNNPLFCALANYHSKVWINHWQFILPAVHAVTDISQSSFNVKFFFSVTSNQDIFIIFLVYVNKVTFIKFLVCLSRVPPLAVMSIFPRSVIFFY